MLGPAFGALDLLAYIVHESIQAGLAERVLTGQQFGLSVPVQANAAGEQLLQLIPSVGHLDDWLRQRCEQTSVGNHKSALFTKINGRFRFD